MDNRLTPEQKQQIIENALRSRPLTEMPRDISVDVMKRIRQTSAPRFQVTWQDFALALALSLSVGALLFAVQNLPPLMVARLQIQGILLYQDLLVNARWLVPSTLFVLAALLVSLAIPALIAPSQTSK